MRDFLTGIAVILIVVLTTVLVAPYFVDWNGQRDFLEARLSHALGQKVTVGGAIDLKLLPTPYLVLDQVVVGADEAPIRIGVRHLNLELAIAPLLHGEFDIVEARLREPTIRMTLEPDHSLPTLPAAPAFSADVRFDRIRVSDGTLAIADAESGRTFVLDHLDIDADASSFAGPFKIVGAGGPADRRTNFRLSTGAAKGGRARARLVVDETSGHAGLDFDGMLDLQGADGAKQSVDGKLILSGHVLRRDADAIGWRLSGPVQGDPRQARIDAGELRIGSEEAGLTLQADAQARFGEAARLALDLKAKQLDIDRLAGLPTDGARKVPQLPGMEELRGILASATPAVPTDLGLSVETATYGGETLSSIEARATVGDASAHPVKLAVDGPGGAHVAADGTLAAGPVPSFTGTVDASAEDLPRTLDWVRSVAPAFPWAGRDARFERVKLAGPVKLSAVDSSSNGLSIVLDRTKLNGKARLTFASGGKAKLLADLTSDALDLDSLPTLDALRGDADAFDLDLRLDAKAVKVSRVGDGTLDAGRIRLDVAKDGEKIALRDLRIDGLGSASVAAKGDLQRDGGKLSLTLDGDRLETAASLVGRLAPGPISAALVARAPALAPAKLRIDVVLSRGKDGALTPNQLDVHGNLGETKVEASTKPDSDNARTISASLQAPDGSALLHQLGFDTVPIATIGASRVTLSARGQPGDPLDTKLESSFGATKVGVTGRFDLFSNSLAGSGGLELRSPDLTPLLQTLAIAFPDMTGRMPADAIGRLALDDGGVTATDLKGRVAGVETKGELRWRRSPEDKVAVRGALEVDRLSLSGLVGLALGHEQQTPSDAAWSRQPFVVGLVDPPRAAFSLKTKLLGLVPGVEAMDASLDLDIAPNTVSIQNLSAAVSGGRLEGGAKLRRDGRQATVEGKLALDKVNVRLTGTLDTSLTAKLDFAGSGTSAFGLMSSIAGSGDATATDLRMNGADPKALTRIFDDVEADVLAVDQDAVVRGYEDAQKGSLAIGTVGYGISVSSGVVRFDPKTQNETVGSAASKVDASLDLPRATFAAHVEETLAALPKNWSGAPPSITITLDGPLGKPKRSIDVSNFLNAVAARALARESARIEAFELDVRERAFFNARLLSERRREEERQKGEADARKAEAERRAKAERQERARKEQAAKDAREAEEKAAHDAAEQGARDKGQKPPNPPGESPPPPAPEPAQNEPRDPSSLGRY